MCTHTNDLLEKLALIFLYNIYREHSLLKSLKKISSKINEKSIKPQFLSGSLSEYRTWCTFTDTPLKVQTNIPYTCTKCITTATTTATAAAFRYEFEFPV